MAVELRPSLRVIEGEYQRTKKNEGHLCGTGGTPRQMTFTDSRSTWGEVNAAGRL
jgi:hypothetical protein